MSDVGAFGLLLSAASHFYNWLNPPPVTVCGYHSVGKSNLDYRLTTDCDVVPDEIPPTHHEHAVARRRLIRIPFLGYRRKVLADRYILPPATRKRVVFGRDKLVLRTSDIGGHEQYWHLGVEDAVLRNSRIVLFMIDDRDLEVVDGVARPSNFIESQSCFLSLVTSFVSGRYGGRNWRVRMKLPNYAPDIIAVVGNKALKHTKEDGTIEGGWLTEKEIDYGPIIKRGHPLTSHPIFAKFRRIMHRANVHLGAKTFQLVMDAKSGWGVSESLKYLRDNL